MKVCWICGAGPRGLRSYEWTRVDGVLTVVSWVCAEWKVPCSRRRGRSVSVWKKTRVVYKYQSKTP